MRKNFSFHFFCVWTSLNLTTGVCVCVRNFLISVLDVRTLFKVTVPQDQMVKLTTVTFPGLDMILQPHCVNRMYMWFVCLLKSCQV